MRKKIGGYILLLLTLFYIMMLGGGMYEQLNITPKIASAPPQSLAMMQGPYGFNPIRFWVLFRPITILLFLLSIMVLWRNDIRKWLLMAFSIDVLVTVATYLYFAPETGVIAAAPFTDSIDPIIQRKAQLWASLNWLRILGFLLGSSLLLIAVSNMNRKASA